MRKKYIFAIIISSTLSLLSCNNGTLVSYERFHEEAENVFEMPIAGTSMKMKGTSKIATDINGEKESDEKRYDTTYLYMHNNGSGYQFVYVDEDKKECPYWDMASSVFEFKVDTSVETISYSAKYYINPLKVSISLEYEDILDQVFCKERVHTKKSYIRTYNKEGWIISFQYQESITRTIFDLLGGLEDYIDPAYYEKIDTYQNFKYSYPYLDQ